MWCHIELFNSRYLFLGIWDHTQPIRKEEKLISLFKGGTLKYNVMHQLCIAAPNQSWRAVSPNSLSH